ncbi:MAG: DUF255 domain-containing protein [Dysgonamonadaceae bacterium]|jgi:thiol:disulfide interchange protein|nr:DUF255 domain-containing protein [Dysgonamonadaceae bacterium]
MVGSTTGLYFDDEKKVLQMTLKSTIPVSLIKEVIESSAPVLQPSAPAQGIKFVDYKSNTLDDVLKKAQSEDKYIFVDIWTPWCGVCKLIDRYIFTRKDAGDCFNEKFVNLTFDAEYNKHWAETGNKLNATSYPMLPAG